MKVFIVDDSQAVRERLVTLLKDMDDVEVVGQAGDVRKAVESIQATRPEVVILDIRMPGGSGIDVLQAIKADYPAPVTIMLTNYPYSQYRKRCMEAGADFFLDKSSEFHKVPQVLAQLSQTSGPGDRPRVS
jgi:DNA-binding NarL/FixJ family response regulator